MYTSTSRPLSPSSRFPSSLRSVRLALSIRAADCLLSRGVFSVKAVVVGELRRVAVEVEVEGASEGDEGDMAVANS